MGSGFTHKWNMGWMHDTLDYWSTDPLYRRWHHDQLTFGLTYAWSEHFVLPLSHDEVVHLKGSLLAKMPGRRTSASSTCARCTAWMWAHPGGQLLFMGGELADPREWDHDRSLDWDLLLDPRYAGCRRWWPSSTPSRRSTPPSTAAMHDPAGFSWLDVDDADDSHVRVRAPPPRWRRRGGVPGQPVRARPPRVPRRRAVARPWCAALTTDDVRFGGRGGWHGAAVLSEPVPWHGREHSVVVTLPARSVTWLVRAA